MSSERAEILIIGAGPSGCTAAAYLARAGRDVLLVDHTDPPPKKVGESLVPACAEVFAELGVDMHGFKVKHGAVFTQRGDQVRFPFDEGLRNDWPIAWHTPRDELDARMRDTARAAGARFEIREVTGFDLPTVHTRTGDIEAGWVIDAAGRTQLLARALGIRVRHPTYRHSAITSWFSGVRPQAPEEDGDVALCAFEGGWFWFIPFADGTWSVGAVTTPAGPKGPDRFEHALSLCPAAAVRLEHATPLHPLSGVHDISVSSERFQGPGWALLGDAACFLDPIFSTGVALGMRWGRSLSEAILSDGDLATWEEGCRASIEAFEPLVDAFYNGTFMEVALADRSTQHETVRKAIISLLAGDVFDPGFAAPRRLGKRFPSIHRMVTGAA